MKRFILPILALFLVTTQVKPIDNSDPRLIGLVIVGAASTLAGSWIAKSGVQRLFWGTQATNPQQDQPRISIFRLLRAVFDRAVGIPITAAGLSLGAAGIGTIIFSKEILSQTDWAAFFAKLGISQ